MQSMLKRGRFPPPAHVPFRLPSALSARGRACSSFPPLCLIPVGRCRLGRCLSGPRAPRPHAPFRRHLTHTAPFSSQVKLPAPPTPVTGVFLCKSQLGCQVQSPLPRPPYTLPNAGARPDFCWFSGVTKARSLKGTAAPPPAPSRGWLYSRPPAPGAPLPCSPFPGI